MVQARLLDIAIREFAIKGLDGASTRGIAAAAGTAMSSITYHYGGKAGLYRAAADHIAGEMADVSVEFGTDAIVAAGDPAAARDAIKAILSMMAGRLAGQGSENWSLFIMREQMSPTDAFDRIYAGPMGAMMETLVELVCVATAANNRETARVAVLTLFGQVLMLRAGRATCARLLRRDPGDAEVIASVRHRVAANVDAILDAMTIEQRERA